MALDLSFPRRPVFEVFLANAWRDLTAAGHVRQSPAITITRGRKDEAAKPSPALCKLTLDDTSHDYSPADPMGAYYGNEFLNAPARLALEVGKDAFTRSVGSGWGTSPQNGAWSVVSSGSGSQAVSSNEGRHTITAANAYQMSTLETIAARDLEVRVSVTIDSVATVTGASLEPANIVLRRQNAGADYYLCRMTVNTSQQVQLSILYRDTTTIASAVTLGTAYSGQQWRVAAAVEGRTLRFKAWPTTGVEPLDWALTADAFPLVAGAGHPGVRSGRAFGNTNTNTLFRYDDFEIRLPRFSGEVSKWDPSRALGEVDRTVDVEVSGLSRRLSQFRKPLRSASYRHITTTTDFTLIDYWPLDEESGATDLGANQAGGTPAQFVQYLDGSSMLAGGIKWGTPATLLPGIDRAVELTNAGELHLPVNSGAIGTTWTASWVQKISQAAGGRVHLRSAIAADDVHFTFYTDGSYLVDVGTGITFTTIFTGNLANPGNDDVWHTISFTATQTGGSTCTYRLSIDGFGPDSTALTPVTFSPLIRIEFQGGDVNTTPPGSFGQVIVCPEDNGTNDIPNRLYLAAHGHEFESGLARFTRLCDEEGVATEFWADEFAFSPYMGPQSAKPLMTLLDDCVVTDRGTRYEPKGANSVAMRTLWSAINQAPAATLSYANGYIGAPFQPTTDDQGLINAFTAKRPNGGQATYARTTGPKNTADPGTQAGAVGMSDAQLDINVPNDTYLPDQAQWRVNLSTVDRPRFRQITVDLRALTDNAIAAQLMDIAIDDLTVVTNASAAGIYDDVRQIVRGYTESINTAYRHHLVLNCSPADPYDAIVLDASTAVLAGGTDDGNPSTITVGVNSSATSLTVASTGYLWKTGAQTTPATLGGERVTVTNVTGSSSPQTFTVTRSVNGVVKSHTAGTAIEVFSPVRLAPKA